MTQIEELPVEPSNGVAETRSAARRNQPSRR